MPKKSAAAILGAKGGKANSKDQAIARRANAEKARAAKAATLKTRMEKHSMPLNIPELEPDRVICSKCNGFFQPDNGATLCFYCTTEP